MRFSLKILGSSALAMAALTVPAAAQTYAGPPTAKVKAAMQALSWLEGTWEGEGWRLSREGREEFQAREVTGFELDGIILVAEGRGWRIDENGDEIVGHHAIGILSYDPHADEYRFAAYTKDGYQSTSTPEVGEKNYTWTVPAGPGAYMKYHARLTDEGEWLETGARCADDTCMQNFEMRLRKVEN